MFGKLVSNMMIKPGQSPVFGDPSEYGLEYERVEFRARDDVALRGWLIKGRTDKVIVQTHFGVQCSRSGYSPKRRFIKMWKQDIPFLRQARHFVDQGYSVLMYDMRNHGESEHGTCPWVSWGPEEAKDVLAAVDFVSNHAELGRANIGLLSICMGAAASTYAFGMGADGLAAYTNVKAMVAVQPLHYREFVKAFGMPGFLDRAGKRVSLKTGWASTSTRRPSCPTCSTSRCRRWSCRTRTTRGPTWSSCSASTTSCKSRRRCDGLNSPSTGQRPTTIWARTR